jgi:hypothetical protein
MATSARAGGLAREVIRANTPQARVSGVVREVLVQDVADQARIGGVVREALVTTAGSSPATKIYIDGLVREALVFWFGPAQPVPPGQAKKYHFTDHREPEDLGDWPFFVRRRAFPIVPSRQHRVLPVHHTAADEAEDLWPFFIRRPVTPLVLPRPLWQPWLHHAFADDDSTAEDRSFLIRRPATFVVPVVTVPGVPPRLWLRQLDETEDPDWLFFIRRLATAPIVWIAQKPCLFFATDAQEDSGAPLFTRRFAPASAPAPPTIIAPRDTLFIANIARWMGRGGAY